MWITRARVGSYYLVVSREYYTDSVSDLTYRLTPQFEASPSWETEFNGLITSANPVAMNNIVFGTMRHDSDEDWFRVEVPQAGTFQIRFNGAYSTDYDSWTISLRDWRNTELQNYSYPVGTKKAKIFTTTSKLDPGTYYINVSGVLGVRGLPLCGPGIYGNL